MTWIAAFLLVKARGAVNRLCRRRDWSGLTVHCTGCDSPDPHDAHLAAGALTYLGGRPW